MRGVDGSLLSLDVLDTLPPPDRHVAARVRDVLDAARRALGPASAARAVHDAIGAPLFDALGVLLSPAAATGDLLVSVAREPDACVAAAGWNQDLPRARTRSMSLLDRRPRWWIGTNGAELRIVDNVHAFSRRFTSIALDGPEEDAAGALAALLSAGGPSLDALVARSHAHRAAVARSLQHGVEDALVQLVAALASRGARRRGSPDEALAEALTVVYRILFLLFAEARGLVPGWHPTYRRSYTIESLRPAVERGGPVRGLWAALQAISRLAHRGCRAGALRVTPFNGRLFAPSGAPLAEQARLDDRRIREVLLALTTRRDADRRTRISYADLGVEQLGAVYERVLEFTPAIDGGAVRLAPTARRKSTGTFYTPRAMTEYLVRRTLAPLVRGRTPDGILALRIVDPAMGSGAFLVAACRYLADAYERALVAEGSCSHDGVTAADRAAFRRLVAQRCLYGVDVNPMAVQLARLSLWLCTLTSDRPLTFFDHHLRCGNSLVGASAADVARQRPGRAAGRARADALPLFEIDLCARFATSIELRAPLAAEPDDSLDAVRRKERAMAALDGANAPLSAIRRLCDAWCAAWFWPSDAAAVPSSAWSAFSSFVARGDGELPAALASEWRDVAEAVASKRRFFHWELEFPEMFFTPSGEPLASAGFDAVIGNPPWDTLRGDAGDAGERRDAGSEGRRLTSFVRESGCYVYQGDGHANLYQAFAERMLRLARAGGRTGLLMPAGLMTDHGSTGLRRLLFDGFEIDSAIAFDNRDALFPIHRGVRFVLLAATRGGRTEQLQARVGMHAAAALEDVPDEGPVPGAVTVPRSLIARFGGDALVVPELASPTDRAIVAKILARAPALGSPDGWGARFGRELNATDDRASFGAEGLPILEGKHLEPFRARVPPDAPRIDPRAAAARLPARPFDAARLGYREVAGATNRLTLIAAMIPAGCATTHTIFCLRSRLPAEAQWFLCGIFNSFVANYIVRLRGGTHVPASTIHELPVPADRGDARIARIGGLAKRLGARDDEREAIALQSEVASMYGLAPDELDHVLATFPLVPASLREAVSAAFRAGMDAI